jgi:outer membrane protein
VNATERAVVSAQAPYAAQQKGFEYGTVTAVDVLDAGQSLYEAKRDFHRAYYDLMLHWLGLQQVSGQFTPDHIVELNDWLNVAAAH